MKKKKTAYISAAVLFLIAGTLVAYAYFQSTAGRTNTVKAGGNTISINETGMSLPDDDNPQNKETVYDKPVKIDNTGDVACYVRVRLDFSDDTVKNLTKFSVGDSEDFVSINDNYTQYLEKLGDDWKYSDGYFYYTKPIESGSSTPYLLKKVRTEYDSAEIQAYDIYVYAESVQAISSSGKDEGCAKAWNEFLGDSILTEEITPAPDS